MKAVVQRVKSCELSVGGKLISSIGKGLVVYFGVAVGDDKQKVDYLSTKITNLRVFEDENQKMNFSVKDVGGQILAVSQFTLLGEVRHGNRPDFVNAEKPQQAKVLYDYFLEKLSQNGVEVFPGVFGADMTINQVNDGPVTIIYEI